MLIDIDVHMNYALANPADLLLQITGAATSTQRIDRAHLATTGTRDVTYVPAEDKIGTRAWLNCANDLICDYSARIEITRTTPDLTALPQTAPHELPGPAVRFLMPSRYCPTELFESMVKAEFNGLEGGQRVAAMREFVANWMSYVPGASGVNTTAADSFVKRQGICRDYAHVLIAMLRASTIPARFVSCYAPDVDPPDFHAIVEVWLDGAWHLVDPTGMADPAETVVIGVGLDAAETSFLTIFGTASFVAQSVKVSRAEV